jgi:3-hydroxyacyl-CoA dehydrogenase
MALTLSAIKGRPVVVLGGGALGRRIACTWAAGGWDVRIRDPSAEQRTAALHYVENNIAAYASVVNTIPGKTSAHEDLAEAVKDAWTVIEAVPEKLSLKISTFADLEKLAPTDAILVSCSSSYKSSEILEKVGSDTKKRIMNTHYIMPPDSQIVELMTDGQTDPEIFPFYVERLKEMGMHPIVAKRESPGFVINRVWAAIKRECLMILAEEVSTPEELDQVWVEMFGREGKMGPCAMMDAVGLDTVAVIEQHYIKERGLNGGETVDFLEKNYISQGKLGAKSGKGGLYPPGHNKAAGEERHSYENLHVPSL